MGRYLEMGLLLRRRTTGETLLFAGGVWDKKRKQYTDKRPRHVRVIEVNESQVPFVRYFAGVLEALREGRELTESLVLAVGDRRAGKTFITVICLIAFAIELPRLRGTSSIAWVVSKSYQERDEIEKVITDWIPDDWYTPRRAPEYRYIFKNGAVVKNLSAKDPESLRRGRADCILYNEAQKMPVEALENGIYGTADVGGLAIIAANPPRRKIGEWLLRLKEAVDESRVGGVLFFQMSSKDSVSLVKPARERVGAIVRLLNPRGAAADDDGLFLPIGDKAYEKFDGKRHLQAVPELAVGTEPEVGELPDVTMELVRKKVFGKFEYFGGADFQGTPWNAAVALRAYGDKKSPVYHVVAEFLKEGWEDDLLDEIAFSKTFTPENTVWVGDASGTWQDAHHSRGRVSFDIFKARRWRIVPPTLKKSDRGEHPRNPNVLDRVNLVNRLLVEDRLFIDPVACKRLAEAMRECDWKNDKPRGKHAHITDALGYALWWIEPAPEPYRSAPVSPIIAPIYPQSRGPRIL